jgi:hypothetical protein
MEEPRDQGFPGEFGRNTSEPQEERRFGEEAHAYNRAASDIAGQPTPAGPQRGGMAESSAVAGTGSTAGIDSDYGSPMEGTQQGSGIGSADHGAVGTVNMGSGAGLSGGNATNGTGFADDPDSAWQRERSSFQEHFTARHPAQGEATAGRTWDQAESNYRYGYEAARSGRFQGRTFDEIEPDLQRDYESNRHGTSGGDSWEHLREEVRAGFHHTRQG